MINILYEDNHLLVVEKPINCLVQEDNTKDTDLLTLLKQNGTLVDYLEKDEKRKISFVSSEGKIARLNYEVISIKENKTLVKINLETGRHHQIRVQFSHFGYPLYGDAKYNKKANLKDPVALFAKELSFYHPITKELLTFRLDLPKRYPFSIFE